MVYFRIRELLKKNKKSKYWFIKEMGGSYQSLSHLMDIETNTFSYCISFGNDPNGFVINDKAMGSDYADDFCIIFGVQKIYYNRHIIRAFEECKKNLLPFIK